MSKPLAHHIVRQFKNGSWEENRDAITVEEPVEIVVTDGVRRQTIAVTMRTPGHDAELAVGFLVSEGLLRTPSNIQNLIESTENRVDVTVDGGTFSRIESSESLDRHSFVNSSCGVCGRTSMEWLKEKRFRRTTNDFQIRSEWMLALPAKLKGGQTVFDSTGGLHAAAVFDAAGNCLVLREDVGRHNAVDKTLGWLFREGKVPANENVLMVSGRLSYEIVQKALSGGIPIVAAVSAPSNLAVKIANEWGMTLVGFLRDDRFNVYTGHERIV